MTTTTVSASPWTDWKWENAVAGSIAGLATVAFTHPLDVVRTRFQVYDGRNPNLPCYKNTPHALFTIGRLEGLRGLYSGFSPAVLGSTVSWGLYFYFYNTAKQRYMKRHDKTSAYIHLASAAEAGGLVCLITNPIWVVKTRLQLQTPQNQYRAYSGFGDALKTILRDEGWRALYKGLLPGLFLVTHGAIQFAAYEEFRDIIVDFRAKRNPSNAKNSELLTTVDYATLGASSKLAAILATYPFQVIRSRLQQRPMLDGVPRYVDSGDAMTKTAKLEGPKGFYRGITANLLKNLPAASITFIVYENVLHLLKRTGKNN
ncbi:folate transporter 1, chloroplastic-like [Rutidosis leptorrhynchoides]|uniref:folate transporter 1, chloroplastic-like n=1 Tax=Rutidosis leptorrhynchoides TaxID=125765 RepID=UPI003A98F7B9